MALHEFLESSRDLSREVKSIWPSSTSALADRLIYFQLASGSEIDGWTVRDVRHCALKAAISFIQRTPYLHHTPSSLRSLFSVPTRSHRKKGKHSAASLRGIAEEHGLLPDWELLDRLALYTERNQYQNRRMANIISSRIHEIKRRPIHISYVKKFSDHSDESLRHLEEFLKDLFPNTTVSRWEADTEERLTPDLVLNTEKATVYVELKEWESKFKLLFKPGLQVLKYGLKANGVIFVLTDNSPTIFDDLQGTWTSSQLLKKMQGLIQQAKYKKKHHERLRSSLSRFLRGCRPAPLDIMETCVLLTIIEEISGEALGISTMEHSSALELTAILENVSTTRISVRDCNLTPCSNRDLDELVKEEGIHILLIKGFPKYKL